MPFSTFLILVLLGLSGRLSGPAAAEIFGRDDRQSLNEVSDEQVRRLADSTVAIFEADKVRIEPASGGIAVKTEPYGEGWGFGPDERFLDAPTGSYCSGALVGPDLILTAGHCVKSFAEKPREGKDCRGMRIVFGFRLDASGKALEKIRVRDLYGCKEVVHSVYNEAGWEKDREDWAILRLDRRVEGREPLLLDEATVRRGNRLFMVGHPKGLPAIHAGNAIVTGAVEGLPYFTANLDSLKGNSGSAVFSRETGRIVGILAFGFYLNERAKLLPDGSRVMVLSSRRDPEGDTGVVRASIAAPRLREALAASETRLQPAPAKQPGPEKLERVRERIHDLIKGDQRFD